MIEFVYKEGTKETGGTSRLLLPKNIRQIGEPEGNRKIYIEDYVLTYLKQFAKEEPDRCRGGILLGDSERMDGLPYLFIRSAIALKAVEISGEENPFSEETWTGIYGTMKEYFAGQDILGWFLSMQDCPLELHAQLTRLHVNYFGGVDKVLLVGDASEGEEDFFAYENGKMIRQRGYYIFYERNEAMQRYMVETGSGESIDEREHYNDQAIRNFRAIIQEKKEASGQKRVLTFLYMASTFLVMVVMVIGITLLNNYEKMENLEMALSEISQSLDGGRTVDVYNGKDETAAEEEAAGEKEEDRPDNSEQDTGEAVGEGMEETVPEPQPEEREEAASAEVSVIPEYYVVEKGDTLARICRRFYGSDEKLPEICELNGIKDNNHILAGEKLLLP